MARIKSGIYKCNTGFIEIPYGRQEQHKKMKARMQEKLQLKHVNKEMDNVGPCSLPINTTQIVHAGARRILTIQAGIEDFELRDDNATHVGISDGNGVIKMIPIAVAKRLQRRVVGLPFATLIDIHLQLVDGNINVKFNAKGCK